MDSQHIIKKLNFAISSIEDEIRLELVLPLVVDLISQIIKRNFDNEGAWNGDDSNIDLFSGGSKKWEKLANPQGDEFRKLLRDTGNLYNNIEVGLNGDQIYISSNAPYSAIHQFGFSGNVTISEHERTSKKGKKFKVKQHSKFVSIPARPFIVLSEDDLEEIYELIASFIGSN